MAKPTAARKDASNIIYSTAPDVCWTPMGSTMVPVAYNSIAFLDSAIRTGIQVHDNRLKDFHLNSRASISTGHEPGTGKGIKVPGYKGMALAERASSTGATDGYAVVRDGDPAWINRPGPGEDAPQSPLTTTKVKIA
jgi:hypothetical protein